MAKQSINIGTTANDGTGDPLRTAFDKTNDNFTEVYGKPDIDFDSGTSVITLTRADATTDTVDLSGLLDDTVRTVTAGGNTLASNETLAFTEGTGISITESGGAVTIASTVTSESYSAGTGLDLNTQTNVFSLETDLRDGVTHIGLDTGDYIEFTDNTRIDFYVNGSNEMRLEADGDLHVDGDVIAASTTISSDERLKDNIETIQSALETVSQIKGVNYNWKSNGEKASGVIAQDVQKVMPHLVKEVSGLNSQEAHLAVNYDGLIGLLIEAVKELSNKLENK